MWLTHTYATLSQECWCSIYCSIHNQAAHKQEMQHSSVQEWLRMLHRECNFLGGMLLNPPRYAESFGPSRLLSISKVFKLTIARVKRPNDVSY